MCKKADASMRLDRLLSQLALGSRAQVRDLIKSGRIRVNDQTVRSAEFHVAPGDLIFFDGQTIDARVSRHIMLNKPMGVLTAARDPKQPTVLDLLPAAYKACGCMPVGRLDKDTEGLLLLTTDGELAHRLLSPKRSVWKCYYAQVDQPLSTDDITAFEQGISLSDFTTLPARLEIDPAVPERTAARAWVSEGKFHQGRRMFAALGKNVLFLKRLSVGPLELDPALAPGAFRELTEEELQSLIQAVT